MTEPLGVEERRFFRDQLRAARAAALEDAEGFQPIVAALERLGSALNPRGKNLGQFRDSLLALACGARGPLELSDKERILTSPEALFSAVKDGRNDAVHQGAHARHLVRHCVEFALLIEEGLMADSRCVADFMVRDPACAEPWQQVAIARQLMLASSFSSLPIYFGGRWSLLTDHAVCAYLSQSSNRHDALREQIETAAQDKKLTLEPAVVVRASATVAEAIQVSVGRPVLVVEQTRLVGIATPFDFL